MARKMTEWPSKRGPITKIMPSDGCKGDTVPLVVGRWYNFHEFGCHLGDVGMQPFLAAIVAIGLLALLPACASFQDRCLEQGYESGSLEFSDCVEKHISEARRVTQFYGRGGPPSGGH